MHWPILIAFLPTLSFCELFRPKPTSANVDDSKALCSNADAILSRHHGPYDVIIIGAGIAGLTAAKMLLDRGVSNFKMLEARSRLGGRIHTESLNDGGYFEVGADFTVSTRTERWLHFATTHNLLKDFDEEDFKKSHIYFDYDGKPLKMTGLDNFRKSLKPSHSKCSEIYRDDSAFWAKTESLHLGADIKSENCSLRNVNRKLFPRRNIRNQRTKLEPAVAFGNSRLVQALASIVMSQNLRDVGVRISFNSQVRKIYWNLTCSSLSNFTFVRTRTGALWWARYVVVTVPIGTYNGPHPILFIPQLSSTKTEAIKRIGVGCTVCVFMTFENRFWPEDVAGMWLIKNPGASWLNISDSFVGFKEAEFANKTLQAWFQGEDARSVEKLDISDISAMLMGLIRNALSDYFEGGQVPKLEIIHRSNWCSDKFAMGSDTYWKVNTKQSDFEVFSEPFPNSEDPLITFAGEASHPTLFGTLEGAWQSGRREGARLADFLGYTLSTNQTEKATTVWTPKSSSDSNSCTTPVLNTLLFCIVFITQFY